MHAIAQGEALGQKPPHEPDYANYICGTDSCRIYNCGAWSDLSPHDARYRMANRQGPVYSEIPIFDSRRLAHSLDAKTSGRTT